jgi:hypothetical protein
MLFLNCSSLPLHTRGCALLRSPRYAPLPTLWLCPLALSSEGRGERLPPLRCGERVGRGSSPRVCYRYPSATLRRARNGAPATLRSGRGQSQRREGTPRVSAPPTDYGLRTTDYGLRTTDYGLRTTYKRLVARSSDRTKLIFIFFF